MRPETVVSYLNSFDVVQLILKLSLMTRVRSILDFTVI